MYDWDGRDRLRRILRPDGVQLNYSYDAFGRRVHKMRRAADGALSNNNFVWDGEVLAAELDDQRGPRAFVHEPGAFEPVLQQQGGETFLCVNDHLGMPKDLVSADGLVVWTAAHRRMGASSRSMRIWRPRRAMGRVRRLRRGRGGLRRASRVRSGCWGRWRMRMRSWGGRGFGVLMRRRGGG